MHDHSDGSRLRCCLLSALIGCGRDEVRIHDITRERMVLNRPLKRHIPVRIRLPGS